MSNHDLVGCLTVEIDDLKAENERLKAEVERLRASSFVTAVPVEEYEKLKSEVERLTATMEKVISASNLIDERNQHLIAEVEWLRKAGDAIS